MSEKMDKKVKGFRIAPNLHQVVDRLIKDSGKDPGEWFEDIIQQVSTNEIVLEKNEIPMDLRKHFSSDIASIKDATNLITTLFINQMNRIAVENNNWNQALSAKQQEFEGKKSELLNHIHLLEKDIEFKESELNDAHNHILQLQNKADGFDKLEAQLRKDIERLELEQSSAGQELHRIREQATLEKEKLYLDIEELKDVYKEEKTQLNQKIVDLVDELKKAEKVIEESQKLKEKIKETENSLAVLKSNHEMNFIRITEQAAVEKEKALLSRERELREELYSQNREDLKELYGKVESLQLENNKLKVELSHYKQQK